MGAAAASLSASSIPFLSELSWEITTPVLTKSISGIKDLLQSKLKMMYL